MGKTIEEAQKRSTEALNGHIELMLEDGDSIPNLKKSVEEILASLGLTTSEAINIYFHQILINDVIPFPIQRKKSDDRTTIDALNEDLSDRKKHNSIDELYDELDIEP